MPIYDSSTEGQENLHQGSTSRPVPPQAQPNIFDAPVADETVQEDNYQNMSDFADIMPASMTPTVENEERALLERLREQDPQKYEMLLSQSTESAKGEKKSDAKQPLTKKRNKSENFFARIAKNLKMKSESEVESWMSVLERPLNRPIVCGFTSFKGCCGKTSLSVITASVMKQARPEDRIIVVDMDPSGNLVNRARGSQYADVQGYVDAIDRGVYDPSPFIMHGGDGIDIIGSRIDPLTKDLTAQQVIEVVEVLVHYYDIVILDMPQRMDNNAYKALLLMLDVVTFVFEAKNDALSSVQSIVPVLEQNQAQYLIDRRVIAFNNTSIVSSRTEKFSPQETVSYLINKENVEVVELPFADSLRNSGLLERENVPSKTYNQFVQLTAAILNTVEDARSVGKPTVLNV